MPTLNPEVTKLVREAIAKMPKASTNAIAKSLVKNYPLLFKSPEAIRTSVRYHRGERGGGRTGKVFNKAPLPKTPFTRENPFGLPDSHAEEPKLFKLPTACDNILIISDLHIPYHNIKAVTTALKYGKDKKVNCIVINGDLMDFHQVSRFVKDPRKRSHVQEIEAGIEFLGILRKTFKHVPIYWLFGNHDIRYEIWLKSSAPILFMDDYYRLEDRMGLPKLKVTPLHHTTIIKAGRLNILHGHTIFRGSASPVSPARTIYMKCKESSICGHTHKISEHTSTRLNGDIVTCWSTGSLCELNPEYAPHANEYAHGFAHVRLFRDSFEVRNFRINDGKIL